MTIHNGATMRGLSRFTSRLNNRPMRNTLLRILLWYLLTIKRRTERQAEILEMFVERHWFNDPC